jgi:hypothetical protein
VLHQQGLDNGACGGKDLAQSGEHGLPQFENGDTRQHFD